MNSLIKKAGRRHAFNILYLASFLLAFHLYFVIYVNSNFLNLFIPETLIGSVWIAGSFLGILSLLWISRILRLFGNYRILVFLTCLEFFIFIGLAFTTTPWLVIPLFLAYLVIYPIILFNLDIFLESFTAKENTTGSVRGTALTVVNMALIIAPLLAGLVLTNNDYWKIYLISALLLIPFLFLIFRLKSFTDPQYEQPQIKKTFFAILKNKNVYSIFVAQLIMRFFFSWMVIYMPLYLHEYVGFSWSELGIMFSIILLPFALLELPAGKIADSHWGEKELLSVGFLITGLFILAIPFVTSTNFFVWTAILYTTRIGASLMEIMTESYFFKHVDANDSNTISFFRITRPVAYITGPAVASLALLFIDFKFIFLILGVIVLFGIRYSLAIQDTK